MAMRQRRIPEALAAVVLACAAAQALAQQAVVAREAPLLAQPAAGAARLAELPATASVEVLERKGGWYRVRAPGGEEGWVKLLALRLVGEREEGGGADPAATAGAAVGGAQSAGASGAAAGALGSMMAGSAADSTAVRGGAGGKLSGKKLRDDAGSASPADLEAWEPSAEDMADFESGLDAGEQP